jgi:hypothetical protein
VELPKSRSMLVRMREARLKTLRATGYVLAGTLVKFPRHNSRYLTNHHRGKTRTMYIPLDRLEEVKEWNANHKAAKRVLAELSEIQRALLCGEIAERRR